MIYTLEEYLEKTPCSACGGPLRQMHSDVCDTCFEAAIARDIYVYDYILCIECEVDVCETCSNRVL